MISDLLVRSKAYRDFRNDVSEGKVSHAYVVVGDDLATRKAYMYLMAVSLLCDSGGCGECPQCEKVYKDAHPNVKKYNLDGKMKVENAVSLIEDSILGGWEGSYKLYFIDNAETLSPAVQNKLLKVFEEPSPGVVIVMFTASELPLLQTIKSRAKKIHLPLFEVEDIYSELIADGHPHAEAELASALSGGSFQRAYAFADGGDFEGIYAQCFDTLKNCRKSSVVVEYSTLPAFSKENIALTLGFIEIILRDVLVKKSGSKAPLNTLNRDYDLEVIGDGFTEAGLAMAMLAVKRGEEMLKSNVAPQTVAERVLLDILEAKYTWRQS